MELIKGDVLEGGDYFYFIKHAQEEMQDIFSDVQVINVSSRAACNFANPEKVRLN